MIWLTLALATAFFYAVQGAWTKRLTRTVRPTVANWAIFAFAFPALAVYLAVDGVPDAGGKFWLVAAVNTGLYVLSFHLYVTAIQRGDLGLTYPLLALTPILVVPVEWLVLGDRAGPRGVTGILLVVAGVYALNFDRDEAGLLAPFRALARDPGARRMLGVTLIWSVSGTLDRVAVLDASPALYGATISGAMALALLPLALWKGRPPSADDGGEGGDAGASPPEGLGAALRRRPGALALQGLLFAAMFVCQMEALRLALASYVISIKRSGTLLTVLMGAAFFGEEKLGRRLAGTLVILAGVFLVATS